MNIYSFSVALYTSMKIEINFYSAICGIVFAPPHKLFIHFDIS
jgi:hypothetical protein